MNGMSIPYQHECCKDRRYDPPSKKDPSIYDFFGVPALVAHNEAYRVARRVERGCEASIRGFQAAVRDVQLGGGASD